MEQLGKIKQTRNMWTVLRKTLAVLLCLATLSQSVLLDLQYAYRNATAEGTQVEEKHEPPAGASNGGSGSGAANNGGSNNTGTGGGGSTTGNGETTPGETGDGSGAGTGTGGGQGTGAGTGTETGGVPNATATKAPDTENGDVEDGDGGEGDIDDDENLVDPDATEAVATPEPTPDLRPALQRAIEDEGGAYVSISKRNIYTSATLETVKAEIGGGVVFAVSYEIDPGRSDRVQILLRTRNNNVASGFVAASNVRLLPREATAQAMEDAGVSFYLDEAETVPLRKMSYVTPEEKEENAEPTEEPTEELEPSPTPDAVDGETDPDAEVPGEEESEPEPTPIAFTQIMFSGNMPSNLTAAENGLYEYVVNGTVVVLIYGQVGVQPAAFYVVNPETMEIDFGQPFSVVFDDGEDVTAEPEEVSIAFEDHTPQLLPDGFEQYLVLDGGIVVYSNVASQDAAPQYSRFGREPGGALGFYACSVDGVLTIPLALVHDVVQAPATIAFVPATPERLPNGYMTLPVLESGAQLYVCQNEGDLLLVLFGTPEGGALGYYAADDQGELQVPLHYVQLPLDPFIYLPIEEDKLPENAQVQSSLSAPQARMMAAAPAATNGVLAYDGDDNGEFETFAVVGAYQGVTGLYESNAQGTVADAPVYLGPLRGGFGLFSYTMSTIAVTLSASGVSPSDTNYAIDSNVLGSGFTVQLTPDTQTGNTALIVKVLDYGMVFSASQSFTGDVIASAVSTDKKTYAILLNDGLTGPVNIPFATEKLPLTDAQSASIIAGGVSSIATSNISAVEYELDSGTVLTLLVNPGNYSSYGAGQYFAGEIPLKLSGTVTLNADHTYQITVSPVASVANSMMGSTGAGSDTNAAAYEPGTDPNLRFSISQISDGASNLVELTKIKLYAPSEKLELVGLANTPDSGNNSCVIADADYDVRLDGWSVGVRQQDVGGYYYMLTPPVGNKFYNNSNNYTTGQYGMRLLWKVASSATLDDATSYQAKPTVIYYKAPGQGEQTFTATGPSIKTKYNKGTITVDTTSSTAKNSTFYTMQEPILDGDFTVNYTPGTGQPTENTVLVVKGLDYGMQWDTTLTTGGDIAGVQKDGNTYYIQLANGCTSLVSIPIPTKYAALSNADAVDWMTDGILSNTNITVEEYRMHTTTLAAFANAHKTSPSSLTLQGKGQFFDNDITLQNQTGDTITASHTYTMTASTVVDITKHKLGAGGAGSDTGNPAYYDASDDPNLMFEIPTLHSANTGLIEIESIRVYVPTGKLELVGVSNTPTSASSIVSDTDYDSIWNDWNIGTRKGSGDNAYYDIVPSGDRVFNTGADPLASPLAYGMRLLWDLDDDGQPLEADTTYEAASKTVVTYKLPNGPRKTVDFVGPSVRTTYIPGSVAITTTSTALPGDTTYLLTDDIRTKGFTVTYTPSTVQGTSGTVLMVKGLKYGMSMPTTLVHADIKSVLRVDDETYAIVLNDGVKTPISIPIVPVKKELTNAESAAWLSAGDLDFSNITAEEHQLTEATLAAFVTKWQPGTLVAESDAQYFTADVRPENTTNKNTVADHTYSVSVSSIASVADEMLGLHGVGGDGVGLPTYIYGPKLDPNLMFTIPTVHNNNTPLMEITDLKVYAPPGLKLIGVADTVGTTGPSDVKDSDYTHILSDWTIDDTGTDGGGTWYKLVPPTGTHLYNNTTTRADDLMKIGMRLLWAVDPTGTDLNAVHGSSTSLQAGGQSEINYNIPNGTPNPSEEKLQYASPVVETWALYDAGTLNIIVNSNPPRTDTEYYLTDTYLDKGFTVTYSAALGGATNKTALLIEGLDYGMEWDASLPMSTAITNVIRVSDTSYLITLADGIHTNVVIDFATKFRNINQDDAIEWMTQGKLKDTNYRVQEFQLITTNLQDIINALADPSTPSIYATAYADAQYFDNDITLANPQTQKVVEKNTYNMSVSSIPGLTNYMMSNLGAGTGTVSTGYYGPTKDPALRLEIPYVHSTPGQDVPLMEFKSLVVTAPTPLLKLVGVSNTTESGTTSCAVGSSGYSQQWGGWVVTTSGTDEYTIAPPAGTHLFNYDRSNSLYGLRLHWALKNDSSPLGNAPTTYTTYASTVNTVFNYTIPNSAGTDNVAKTHDFVGPVVQTWAKQTEELYHAYGNERYTSNPVTPTLPVPTEVEVGATYWNRDLSYVSNQWRRGSNGSGIITEYHAKANGEVVQTYEFPFEIQPFDLTFTEELQDRIVKNAGVNATKTKIKSITFTRQNADTFTATTAQIDAINNVYTNNGGSYKLDFKSDTDYDRNPVRKIVIVWDNILTEYQYPNGTNMPRYNSSGSLLGNTSTVKTLVSFRVAENDEQDIPIVDGAAVQGTHTAEFKSVPETLTSPANYLWWKIVVPQCPTVMSELGSVGVSILADNTTTRKIGDLLLYVGWYGERIDVLQNPTIDLGVRFNNSESTSAHINNLTGMTEAQGIAFLTGKFRAMPKLSGWTFSYTTNQNASVRTKTVPAIPAGGELFDIGLAADEYFTSLSLKYTANGGAFDTSHDGGIYDATTIHYLMREIEMRALNKNPTGGALNTDANYKASYIQLTGKAYWDNCVCTDPAHANWHDPSIKQDIIPRAEKHRDSGKYLPQMPIWFTRQAQLEAGPGTVTTPVKSQYQGLTVTDSLNIVAKGSTSGGQWYPFGTDNKLPWNNDAINEIVYIELKDPLVRLDLDQCSLFGVPVSSGNVLASYITTPSGITYAKFEFKPGFQRPESYFAGDQFVAGNTSQNNAAGALQLQFTITPGAPLGEVYPIGKVYFDATDLLLQYDAPNSANDAAHDFNLTNWIINGNGTQAELQPITLDGGRQTLLAYDFSTSYKLNVLQADKVSTSIYPGKEMMDYSFDDSTPKRTIVFRQEHANDLNAMFSFESPTRGKMYDGYGYIYLPKENYTITYFNEALQQETAKSLITLSLRGEPSSMSTPSGSVVSYAYTTSADPQNAPDSAYNYIPGNWAAVTGIRVHIDKLDPKEKINVRLDLTTPEKDLLGDLPAYAVGRYSYKSDPSASTPLTGELRLATWIYTDYDVIKDGLLFWDTYDENGTKSPTAGHNETGAAGYKVSLFPNPSAPTANVAYDSVTTPASGIFNLKSPKRDAGQRVVVEIDNSAAPTAAKPHVKLTQTANPLDIEVSGIDSDFTRNVLDVSNEVVLPQVRNDDPFINISGGLVKLPIITIAKQIFFLGEAPPQFRATMVFFFTKGITSTTSPDYRLDYGSPSDDITPTIGRRILEFNPHLTVDNSEYIGSVSTPITLKKIGIAEAIVKTQNTLGDVVEKKYQLEVRSRYHTYSLIKNWDDNNDARGKRPHPTQITLALNADRYYTDDVTSGPQVINPGYLITGTAGAATWAKDYSSPLPEFSREGNRIVYSVVETPANDADYYKPAVYKDSLQYFTAGEGRKVSATNEIKKPDLQVTKTADTSVADVVYREETFDYEIVVENNGDGRADNIVLEDILPAVMAYQSHSITNYPNTITSSLNYEPLSRKGTLTIDMLKPGDKVVLTITVKSDVNIIEGQIIINTAKITKESGITADAKVGTKLEDSAELTAVTPVLHISKTPNRNMQQQGGLIDYEITVINTGSYFADAIKVTENLPSEMEYQSYSITTGFPYGTSYNRTTHTWTIDQLDPGESITLTLRVKVYDWVEDWTVAHNSVTIIEEHGKTPNTGTLTDTADVTILRSLLFLQKSVDKVRTKPGKKLVFTVVIFNYGPADAIDVKIQDVMPQNARVIKVEAPAGTKYDAKTKVWSIHELKVWDRKELTIEMRVSSNAKNGDEVRNYVAVTTVDGVIPTRPIEAAAISIVEARWGQLNRNIGDLTE